VDVVFKGRDLPSGPWVFKKRLQRPDGAVAPPGAYVGVRDLDGRLLGRGLYNRRSEIALRVLGGPDSPENLRDLLRERLRQAVHLRENTLGLQRHTDAYRLINAEGDSLSGLVVDRYGDTCVASVYALGWINAAEMLEATLGDLQGVDRVLFRADQRTQKLEGFRLPDPEPGQETTIREGRLRFRVDLSEGHKTGLFLDQRDNRARVAGLSQGRTVLDLCTNAGAFALSCCGPGRSGAVTAVDLDERALLAAERNAKLNKLRVRFEHADLFPWLRARIESGDRWDAVVLDPPKLASGPKGVDKACTRYRDMNRLAFQVCSPGAIMATCSCSGAVSEGQFLSVVRAAAQQAGRKARVLELSGPAPDHPVALDFPEGRYLKCALLHVE
jgi:23S rRNA (cytosine1962-C5)-methyltransferase